MARGIILLDHTFRPNSRIFHAATEVCDSLAVIYYSPYYHSAELRRLYRHPHDSSLLHHYATARLDSWLRSKGSQLQIFKVPDPAQHLSRVISDEGIDVVLSDMPQFGRSWDLPDHDEVLVTSIDSSTYDPSERRLTASSRVRSWRRRDRIPEFGMPTSWPEHIGIEGSHPVDGMYRDDEQLVMLDMWIKNSLKRVMNNYSSYGDERDRADGSMRISGLIQHGLIDTPSLVSELLVLDPTGDDCYPLLRQLAFREIALQKTREAGLHPDSPHESWLARFLDDKSLEALDDLAGDGSLTRDDVMTGQTGDPDLDRMIRDTMRDRWMPNRARLFMAGEVLHRAGAREGIRVLIEFFNLFTSDGQAPMSWIGPIECARLNYGRVIRYNRDKALRLLYGK